MIVTNPASVDRSNWSNFVLSHPQGTIFQAPEMYDVYNSTKNYEPVFIAAINGSGKIEAILLAVIQRDLPGSPGFFTSRSIIWGGPLIGQERSDLLRIILKEYDQLIKSKVIYSQIRNFSFQKETLKSVYSELGYEFEDHLNILINLNIGADALWRLTKKNRKDGINKALKQDFKFEVKDHLDSIDQFYVLFKNLYTEVRLPYPDKSFFSAIDANISASVKWFILKYKSNPHIILCSLIYKNRLYAFSIGILQDPDFLKLRPVDLFYWKVIKWGAENGVLIFDWMGAGKPEKEYGVRKFKLQYGGEQFNPGRYEKIHYPILYKTGKLGLSVWRKLKI
jgi:serine/alanine adding enzyme